MHAGSICENGDVHPSRHHGSASPLHMVSGFAAVHTTWAFVADHSRTCFHLSQGAVPGTAQQASRDSNQGRSHGRDASHGRGPRPSPSNPVRRHPHEAPVQSTSGGTGEIRPVGGEASEANSGFGTRASSRPHSRGRNGGHVRLQNELNGTARVEFGSSDHRQQLGSSSRQDSRQISRPPSAPRAHRPV